jgi:hypothetical protein
VKDAFSWLSMGSVDLRATPLDSVELDFDWPAGEEVASPAVTTADLACPPPELALASEVLNSSNFPRSVPANPGKLLNGLEPLA